MKILITGGAGFIGSHVADALIKQGHSVRLYDNLTPQVHAEIPEYLNEEAEFVKGDIRNRDELAKAIKDVEVIFHEAAAVGVAQSMYQIHKYTDVNALGTANLLDILANEKHRVQKLIVAASMSEYGEGAYRCETCGIVYPKQRKVEPLQQRQWEMFCPNCSNQTFSFPKRKSLIKKKRKGIYSTFVQPVATNENKPLQPTSIYAISKQIQEQMCLCAGEAYNIPVVALRYFNVYGTRQSLNNPYTGVMAIFSSRILNNNPPLIFEDGLQTRDFVHINDIVQANLLAMNSDKANGQIFNVGTGKAVTILEIAELLLSAMQSNLKPEIVNKFRVGDIRHCVADISKIRETLGFEPKVSLNDGVKELVEWVKEQAAVDEFEKASRELQERRLTI
ncbi:SDR family NAD(P)-dependent oxidoreductase [Candidatus Poribacteria bacterium]|nr:SDR family NAD(P)-dependent oxidoreductase [Candidatus Poribacteria bacterium]